MEGILPWVLVDDALLPAERARVSAFDRGYLHADGVFETMRVRDGVLVDGDAHLDRLAAGAWALGFAPPARDALTGRLRELVALNTSAATTATADPSATGARGSTVSDAILRVTVSAGVLGEAAPAPHVSAFLRAVDARLRTRRRGLALFRAPAPWGVRAEPAPLARHKTLGYAANVAAQRHHAAGARPEFEAAFVDASERLLEGASTNLFVVTASGIVLTAPDDGAILPVVARARALEFLRELRVPFREERVPWSELAAAPEVFATSSTLPIAPVVAIEGELRPVVAGGMVGLLARLFEAAHAGSAPRRTN